MNEYGPLNMYVRAWVLYIYMKEKWRVSVNIIVQMYL